MKWQQAGIPLESEHQHRALPWHILQRIRLVFTNSLFPLLLQVMHNTNHHLGFLEPALTLYSLAGGEARHGVRQVSIILLLQPSPSSETLAPVLNMGMSCLLALPVKSVLISLACVYSLDKH